jgi:spectinomycin phosphotransferase
MRDRPVGVAERDLALALAEGWRIQAVTMRYARVGGGSYHWAVRDRAGGRWFVTVDDLDDKDWLGETREEVFAGLRAAMDTALALRGRAGIRFAVAPVPSSGGQTVRPLGARHALAVFPFLRGRPGRFGEVVSAPDRARLLDMLAALHGSTPAVAATPVPGLGLPGRGGLESALRELDQTWCGGPFAEPARALLAGAADRVRRMLGTFDELCERVAARSAAPVITHGEPHPGNVIRVGPQLMLIDWDTVGLAPPERDLWQVAGPAGEELSRYTEATGRPVDPDALALYRLRWPLDDTAAFVRQLRSAHHRSAGAEHAWRALQRTLAHAAKPRG